MESSVLNFQSALQSLTFKTFYHNQTQQFGYDNLFSKKRVMVISIPNMFVPRTLRLLNDFNAFYKEAVPEIFDEAYIVSSFMPLVGPWANKHSPMLGLYDDGNFVELVAKEYKITKSQNNLKAFWQYVVIINDGIPEKLWHNPIKENMPIAVVKNPKYAFHNLNSKMVKEYLAL